MYEVKVSMTFTLKVDDTYIAFRIQCSHKDDERYMLVQLEPLFN